MPSPDEPEASEHAGEDLPAGSPENVVPEVHYVHDGDTAGGADKRT